MVDSNLLINESLVDSAAFDKKVGGEIVRKESFSGLESLEKLILEHSPLPASYDVVRSTSVPFSEFTYTELFGSAIYVSPQSHEAASRLIRKAYQQGSSKEFSLDRLLNSDKYADMVSLPGAKQYPSVAILPGSNVMNNIINYDLLLKWAYYDTDMVIKPHPLTNDDDLRQLKYKFGIDRLIAKKVSGYELMVGASRVYTVPTSELGLYASLLGKEVIDVSNFSKSYLGAYVPLFRYTQYPYGQERALARVLSSPYSGVFFKDDPDVEIKIKFFFNEALRVRSELTLFGGVLV